MLITVLIHTFNSQKEIDNCINSAKILSDQIVIIDMESKDKTVDLAKKNKVKIFSFPFSKYVEPARVFGIKSAETNWVFILDSDEIITKELKEEILEVIKDNKFTYYKIPRKNIFGKIKWLKYGGWWPDYQIRLINKKYFVNWPKEIHSTPLIKGKHGFLKNPILHYFHGNLEKMVNKTIIFEEIESDLLFRKERKSNVLTFFRKFFGELYRRSLKQWGFLDGSISMIESIYQAYSKTITYLFLYEKYLNAKKNCPL